MMEELSKEADGIEELEKLENGEQIKTMANFYQKILLACDLKYGHQGINANQKRFNRLMRPYQQ